MASTELSLKRTLTDILEDELYHLNNKNSGVSYHYPISNKAYMANPNPNHSNNNNNNQPINNNISNNNSTNLDETIITIEPEKLNLIPENENYYTSNNNLYNKKETNISNYQLQQQQDTTNLTMFNKYADPSLTTTSILPQTNKLSIQSNGPVVATINMEKLLKSTNNNNNPYNKNNSYTTSRDNLDVKVSNDIETQEINDSYIYFDDNEQQFIPKVHYSLEDNHMSLNNEDAKLIFDDEFSDDDDFDDDSREYDIDDDEIISSLAIENSKNIITKTNNLYSFVDSTNDNFSTTVIPNSNSNSTMSNTNVELDEDVLLDGDDFYEKNSLGKIVVTDEEIKELNRSKSLSLTTRPKMIRNSNINNNINGNGNGNKLRKPLTNINSNTNNNDDSHIKKHKTYLGSDLSGSNTNEIYTCRLVNLITKEPCAAQFSRSYDLTRHQNTIHAKKKIVFRCSECMKLLGNEGYEKTFSRLDALTRHIKSKHENLTPEERQRVTKYAKENIGYATA